MTLGERVRQQRRRAGWTQQVLADRARLSQGLIARIESGNVKDPSSSVIRRLANALGVTADWLIDMNADDPAQTMLACLSP